MTCYDKRRGVLNADVDVYAVLLVESSRASDVFFDRDKVIVVVQGKGGLQLHQARRGKCGPTIHLVRIGSVPPPSEPNRASATAIATYDKNQFEKTRSRRKDMPPMGFEPMLPLRVSRS